MGHGDLGDGGMFGLAVTMWNEAQKHGQLDTKLMVGIVERRLILKENCEILMDYGKCPGRPDLNARFNRENDFNKKAFK